MKLVTNLGHLDEENIEAIMSEVGDLSKAKYKRRWRGPDGKYRYEYDEPQKEKPEKGAELTEQEAQKLWASYQDNLQRASAAEREAQEAESKKFDPTYKAKALEAVAKARAEHEKGLATLEDIKARGKGFSRHIKNMVNSAIKDQKRRLSSLDADVERIQEDPKKPKLKVTGPATIVAKTKGSGPNARTHFEVMVDGKMVRQTSSKEDAVMAGEVYNEQAARNLSGAELTKEAARASREASDFLRFDLKPKGYSGTGNSPMEVEYQRLKEVSSALHRLEAKDKGTAKSEEPMSGIEMLQDFAKAKYKRRWRGKDGNWDYEYEEAKKTPEKESPLFLATKLAGLKRKRGKLEDAIREAQQEKDSEKIQKLEQEQKQVMAEYKGLKNKLLPMLQERKQRQKEKPKVQDASIKDALAHDDGSQTWLDKIPEYKLKAAKKMGYVDKVGGLWMFTGKGLNEKAKKKVEDTREIFRLLNIEKSEEPMDGIEMLQELTKAKYKRRWRGKDGKWQYEYDEPKKKYAVGDKVMMADVWHEEHGGQGPQPKGEVGTITKIVNGLIYVAFPSMEGRIRRTTKESLTAVKPEKEQGIIAEKKFSSGVRIVAKQGKKGFYATVIGKDGKSTLPGSSGTTAKEAIERTLQNMKAAGFQDKEVEKSLEKAQTMPSGNPKQSLGQGAEQGGKLAAVGKQSGSNDAKGGSPGASKPKGQVLSEDDAEDEDNMKEHKKPIEKIRKSVPGGTTPTGQREMVAHEHAIAVSQLQKGEDDVEVGVGLRSPENEPEEAQEPKHWYGQGNIIHFTNQSDLATTDLLKKAENNGLTIHTPKITRDTPISADSKRCKACKGVLAKSLTQCPTCGTDQTMPVVESGVMFKSEYRGQGLRPVIELDLILPNGVVID